jgi:acetyl esterase/lipase
MANLPRLPPRAEHRLIKRVCGLAPSLQRRLFGAPPQLDGQTLASDIHALLKLAEQAGSPSFFTGMTPEEARASARYEATVIDSRPPIPMARVEAVEVPGPAGPLPSRLYLPLTVPEGVSPPLLVYYHGGGWVIGDLDTHDGLCRFLAATAGVAVLSIGYRLAPEHPFPAPVEDAWAAYSWATANAGALGADPERLAVAGDSAGGNLSAVVSLLAREGGGAMPAMQLLIYPVTDSAETPRSRQLFAEGFFLTRSDMELFEAAYLPPGTDKDDPRISVLKAPDLRNLPPAYVTTAGFDPLRDEGEAYALRMRDAGVKVALRRHPGLVHSFANLTPVSPTSRAAMHEAVGALRMGLATSVLVPSQVS